MAGQHCGAVERAVQQAVGLREADVDGAVVPGLEDAAASNPRFMYGPRRK
ncbi:MAG: hypothetical protein WKF58_19090 [Ilumatobacteraceae bacterium]